MNKPIIGIIGAGKLGTTLGNLAIKAGYQVYIASSRPPEEIEMTIDILVNGAIASSKEIINNIADVVILALPLSKYSQLSSNLFEDKIIIDAMNYWWETDGSDVILSDVKQSSSEKVQQHFSKSYVVKALNHIGYHNLLDDARQDSTENRKIVIIATDHKNAVETVAQIVSDFGFNPMNIGALKNGRILEPGSPLFGASLPIEEIKEIVNHELEKLNKKV